MHSVDPPPGDRRDVSPRCHPGAVSHTAATEIRAGGRTLSAVEADHVLRRNDRDGVGICSYVRRVCPPLSPGGRRYRMQLYMYVCL